MTIQGSHRSPSAAMAALLLIPGIGHANPAALLRAAETADQRLSYTGVRTLRASAGEEDAARRVRVWHLAPDRTRIEYLGSGDGNLLIENGSARWFYSHQRASWRPIEWRPSHAHLDLLLRNYTLGGRGTDTVAGRRVLQLGIEPRHPGNPHKRVWIDPLCKMVLREEVRDYQDRLIAASAFERFELGPEMPASLFEPPVAPMVRTAAKMPPRATAPLPFVPLSPRYVPPGYQEERRSALHRGPGEGVYLRYTDGLGTISLLQIRGEEMPPPPPHRDREKREPGGWRFGRGGVQNRMTRRIGDRWCLVMGDIAPDELKKMLESLPDSP